MGINIDAKAGVFVSGRPIFIKPKISKVIRKFSHILKKSLNLVEDTALHRTFVPETSRNKGVNFNVI